MKVAEKKYHQDLFTRYKSDMKKSWNVMKSIINRNKVHIYQTKFKHNGGDILDGNDISNKFNDSFTILVQHLPMQFHISAKAP